MTVQVFTRSSFIDNDDVTPSRRQMSSDTRQIAKRPKASNFTDAEVEHGLRVLAACSGNSRRAVTELEAQGLPVVHQTLRNWREHNPDRYERIQQEVMPAVYARLAENMESFIAEAGAAEHEFLGTLREKKDQLDPKELSNALRNISVSKGISTQRAMDMRGLPTHISVQADVTDLLKSLSQRYGDVVGVATETTASPPDAHPSVDVASLSPANAHTPELPTSSSDRHSDLKQSK